jgi:hypothetical protein
MEEIELGKARLATGFFIQKRDLYKYFLDLLLMIFSADNFVCGHCLGDGFSFRDISKD